MSTSDDAKVERAMMDVVQWLWAAELQLARLQQDARDEMEHLGWPPKIDPTERSKIFARFSTDQHFLLIALGNLVKAVGRAEHVPGNGLRLDGPTRSLMVNLRNLHEHWERERDAFPTGRTGAPYSEQHSGSQPWSMVFHPDGRVMVGGTLDLAEVASALSELDEALGQWQETIAE